MVRANSRAFMEKSFPDLLRYKATTSRKWENSEKPHYYDNWWFKFGHDDLLHNEFLIFIGAKDYSNKEFQIFKVPSSYILSNIEKVDMTAKGWINLYLHMETFVDLRNDAGLLFGEFALTN